MVDKLGIRFMFTGLVFLLLSLNAYADINATVNVSQNFPPVINSVKTFVSYEDYTSNVPSTNFSAPSNKTVYVQINVSDPNGFEDIEINGYLGVKLVLWNTITDSVFTSFGPDYHNATLEYGSVNDAVYTYSYIMDDSDQTRTGNGIPPRYYRVLAQAFDGTDTFNSTTDPDQIGVFTYRRLDEPPTPIQVIFDVRIDVPESKKVITAGDSFYATVEITKISPRGLDDISVSYSAVDPVDQTVDYFTETVSINNTVYRLPVLYIPEGAMSGNYTFKVLVMYLGVGSWGEANFEVLSPPPTTTTTTTTTTTSSTSSLATTTTTRAHGGGGGGGGGGESSTSTTQPEEKKISLDFYNAPETVYAFKGETKPIIVVIENTGEVTVSGVKVMLETSLEVIDIIPADVIIAPKEKKVFILEVRISNDAEVKTYASTLKILTTKVEKTRGINFVVSDKPSDYRKELSDKIDEMENLTDSVWSEAVKVSSSSNTTNVSLVFSLLQRSKTSLLEAREYLSSSRFNNTEQSINLATKLLEQSVIELNKIRSQNDSDQNQTNQSQVIVRTRFADLNWLVVGAFFLMAFLFLLMLYRNAKLDKKVHEVYDLGRIKGMIFGKETGGKDGLKSITGSNKGRIK